MKNETLEERRARKATYMREYMHRSPEQRAKKAERLRRKRATDPAWAEADRARSRDYARAHEDENRARAKGWQTTNRERYLARQRSLSKARSAERVAKAAKWKKDNPNKVRVNAVHYSHLRRVRLNGNGGDAAGVKERIARWKRQKTFLCALCRRRLPVKVLQVDHIRPVAKGGTHTRDNIQKACGPCNMSKADNYTA